VIIDNIIVDGLAILFCLNDRGAFSAFMKGTHGAFGAALDGDFLIVGQSAGRIEDQPEHGHRCDSSEYFFHFFLFVGCSCGSPSKLHHWREMSMMTRNHATTGQIGLAPVTNRLAIGATNESCGGTGQVHPDESKRGNAAYSKGFASFEAAAT